MNCEKCGHKLDNEIAVCDQCGNGDPTGFAPEYDGALCGDCKLCCQNDLVMLKPWERYWKWETDLVKVKPNEKPVFALKHRDNGDCIYLDSEKGCTVHDDAPFVCRHMDCRNLLSYPMSWLADNVRTEVIKAAMKRSHNN